MRRANRSSEPGAAFGVDTVRFGAHLAAELPFLIAAVADATTGWRPLFDNAAISLRAYQVFSLASPLTGHQTNVFVGARPVFGPGPLQSWLLAIPVRIDPQQGSLFAAALFAIVAVALAIEASWSAARRTGAVMASASVILLVVCWPAVAGDIVWNPWFGVVWLYPAIASAWAASVGRVRWWPVAVATASVAAQCQEAFVPLAVAICLVAAVLALCRPRLHGSPRGWLAAGVATGAIAWSAPIVQEITHHPGNLTLLWNASTERVSRLGLNRGFAAIGGALRPGATWLHAPTRGGAAGFAYLIRVFSGPAWLAAAVSVLFVGIAVLAWHRRPALTSAAIFSIVLMVSTAAAIAAIPSSQVFTLAYASVILVPVSTTVLLTVGGSIVVAAGAIRRRAGQLQPARARQGLLTQAVRRLTAPATALIPLSVLCTLAAVAGASIAGSSQSTLGGPAAVRASEAAAATVARSAPRGAFRLQLIGGQNAKRFAILTGAIYDLNVDGFAPRISGIGAPTFGQAGMDRRTITVSLSAHGHVALTVSKPSTGRRSLAETASNGVPITPGSVP